MIITVFNKDQEKPQIYPFSQRQVFVGRNPSGQASVRIDSTTISRNHLALKLSSTHIMIKDLNSSNGTFVEDQQIQPNIWTKIEPDNRIRLAQFQGYLLVGKREEDIPKDNLKKTVKKRVEDSEDSSSRSRSREQKQKERDLPFKISESTLKMLKDMTVNRKSKEQRVKFLKLMGIGKAEEYWEDIERMIKKRKGGHEGKKANEELERQFSQGRTGFEKRGLGK